MSDAAGSVVDLSSLLEPDAHPELLVPEKPVVALHEPEVSREGADRRRWLSCNPWAVDWGTVGKQQASAFQATKGRTK